jgi:hypothetical protein
VGRRRPSPPGATFVVVGRRAKRGYLLADLVGIGIDIGIGSQIVRMVLPVVILIPFGFFTLVEYLIDSGTMTGSLTRVLAAPAETFLLLGMSADL